MRIRPLRVSDRVGNARRQRVGSRTLLVHRRQASRTALSIMLLDETIFTVADVAEPLQVKEDTIPSPLRFLNEPGVIVQSGFLRACFDVPGAARSRSAPQHRWTADDDGGGVP